MLRKAPINLIETRNDRDNSLKMLKTAQGTILDLYIKPESKQFQITIEQDELTVHCTETPVKGRVNKELIKELQKLFKKRITIVSGFTSRQKRVLIKDTNPEEVNKILCSYGYTNRS